MRAIAVDFGEKRIGLAVGEAAHKVARPLQNLAASGTLSKDAEKITEVAGREKADIIVVGLPLDDQGETKMSRICRKLGQCLEERGSKVAYVDEAMTSNFAERDMIKAGLKGSERRKKSDGEAACRMLEIYFEEIA